MGLKLISAQKWLSKIRKFNVSTVESIPNFNYVYL